MYKYTHFIPQNTAPPGAKNIGVYDGNGHKIASIPLGRLTPPKEEPLYSFGLISDIHIYPIAAVAWHPETKFDNVLTYFETEGCVFVAASGDLTQTGFSLDDTTTGLDTRQFAKYKEICDKHKIPVYAICGNHESITNKEDYAVKNQRDLLIEYTGNDLYYTVAQGSDLFIMVGQPDWDVVMNDEEFSWLRTTLEANTDKRCFVFIHSYIEEDSGDAVDFRENSIFENWGTTKTKAFMDLMAQHKNVILFHGHAHIKFECQEYDKAANYTEKNGFKSVHVPSLSLPRDIILSTGETPEDNAGSQGYIVDVYDNYIVLNGRDFIRGEWVPTGVIKIKTK